MAGNLTRDADGRLHRARRSIRKLIALGLSETDVLALFRRYLQRFRNRSVRGPRGPDGGDRRVRLEQARDAIRTLIALGFTESDVADLAEVHPATIARVLDPFEARIVSHDTIQRLHAAVNGAGAQRLRALLPRVGVRVLETCCDKGLPIDKSTRERLENHVRHLLEGILLCRDSLDPFAEGVTGVLAEIGDPDDGITLLAAPIGGPDSPARRLARAKALEHEAEHLLQRYRQERRRLEADEQLARHVAVPKDGRIA